MSLFSFLTGYDENDVSCPTCQSRNYTPDPSDPGKMVYLCTNGHRFGFYEDMGP